MTQDPDLLRLVDGEIVCADGSDLKTYLLAWAEHSEVGPNTPINLIRRDGLHELRIMSEFIHCA